MRGSPRYQTAILTQRTKDMKNSVNPKDVEHLFDEAIEIADSLHHDFVDAAQSIGYSRDVLLRSKPYWVKLAEMSEGTPAVTPIADSGARFVRAYRDELAGLRGQTDIPLSRLNAAAGSAVWFSATSGSVSSIVRVPEVGEIPYEPNPFRIEVGLPVYADRFARLEPALGDSYRQIWEALYGTRADPERSALFLMRQTFDHLFGRLAPDDDVRNSKYWHPKKRDKANQVDRRERIKYAAHTHIKDPNRANTLAASAKQMLDLYYALNAAHTRGELNRKKAREALLAMRHMLEDWADALGL
jgi:hypothetical protein